MNARLALLCAATAAALGQAPRVELDHVFIVVSPGAAAGIAALQRAGLTVDTKIARHPEDGTASVAAFFENAYLELIWVEDVASVTPEHAATAAWFRNAAAWRTSGHSPFGLGLRRVAGDTAPLPVPVQRETAPWLGPDAAYEVLRQSTEARASDFFVVPARAAVPSWIHRIRRDTPALLKHPGGGRDNACRPIRSGRAGACRLPATPSGAARLRPRSGTCHRRPPGWRCSRTQDRSPSGAAVDHRPLSRRPGVAAVPVDSAAAPPYRFFSALTGRRRVRAKGQASCSED